MVSRVIFRENFRGFRRHNFSGDYFSWIFEDLKICPKTLILRSFMIYLAGFLGGIFADFVDPRILAGLIFGVFFTEKINLNKVKATNLVIFDKNVINISNFSIIFS